MSRVRDDAVWTSLPVPALLIDAQGRIEEVNAATETFVNTPARTLRGAALGDMLVVDAPLDEAIGRVRRNLAPIFINDVDVAGAGRTPVQASIQVAPFEDAPDVVLMLIAPREIAERMGRALSVKAAAKSAVGMAQMLAHEIKNPLAGIAGAAQLLSMSLDEDGRELTDLIVGETRRVVKLLEQVEQFGNQRAPVRRAVNIHDILERARKTAAMGFAGRMRIVEDYDPSLPPASGDADQLQQVFLNLIKNASEAAGPDGGTIRLHTFFDHGLRLRGADGARKALPLQIEVIDDGPGLPAEIAGAAFDPFVSGRENGTGLGLALVSKIISDHDGWVAVESVPGRTVFRVSLPVAETGTEDG